MPMQHHVILIEYFMPVLELVAVIFLLVIYTYLQVQPLMGQGKCVFLIRVGHRGGLSDTILSTLTPHLYYLLLVPHLKSLVPPPKEFGISERKNVQCIYLTIISMFANFDYFFIAPHLIVIVPC